MEIVIVALVGMLLGSFLSVLIGRWPHWRGVATGRSHCPNCMHTLAWYDLIPVASWAWLRGRCRYCGGPISPLYPALEVSVAAVLGIAVALFGVGSWWSIIGLVILFGLIALFFFDLIHRMLPDVIVYPLTGVVLFRILLERPDLLVNALAAGVLLSAAFGLLYLRSRGRWLGLGDVKLAFTIGVLFGYPIAIGVTLVAIWVGALMGVGLMLFRRATMTTELPFGSFWTAAAIVTILSPGWVAYLSGLLMPAW
ncbi:MAG: prepilin peptidase [Candidatus Yanofskybacteria bacterium]|nr:prepilin peptidase [Candidatus Yanofskybacteria bacterium]